MRRFIGSGCLLVLLLAGCSASMQGRADTSGETVPVAVELSPEAMAASVGAPKKVSPPTADVGLGTSRTPSPPKSSAGIKK